MSLPDIPRNQSNYQCFNYTRFLILAVSIIMLFFAFGNTLLLNFTIICMYKEYPILSENRTEKLIEVEMFTQSEKGLLYSAVSIGTLMGSLSITYIVGFIRSRRTIVIYGAITGIATILSPMMANWGFIPLFIMRILQGIGGGMTFSSIGYITSAWAPIAASGMFLSWLTSYIQLAPLVTMPVAGFFCESSVGWPGVYYVMGGLTLIFCGIFYVVYRDSPRFHRHVSDKELFTIEKSKVGVSMEKKSKQGKIPYGAILTDKVVLGCMISGFGNFFGFQTFMQFAPVYMNKVLQLDVKSTGLMSALPYLGCLILKFIIGPLSDKLKCVSQLTGVKMYSGISQFTMVICFIVLAAIPPTWQTVAQSVYTILILGSSLNSVGFYKAIQLYAGPFTAVIMSWLSLINALVVLFLPLIKTLLAAEDRPEQWALIFAINAIVVFITTVIFILTVEIELRSWAINASSSKTSVTATSA
ncbi:hypothetical protein FO519_005037 [Halicephalobus sp. NKZ332]|nr:hypothetical protein FO519_005037 [Halicephalobus sp. NKZ332]